MATNNSSAAEINDSNRFVALSQKRLEKFASIFPRVLVSADPETIHDARVYSRRLQQIVRILYPRPGTKKSRKVIRRLRKVRRALGDCRNCDVMTALIQAKIESTGNPVARDALDQLKTFLIGERRESLVRAREKLSRYDLIDFISRSQVLLFSA